jgi:hypothetical protein
LKHAGSASLDRLESLLEAVRKQPRLKEKKRGTFYLKTKAMLHFHEEPAGLFADLWMGEDWKRMPVNTSAEYETLLNELNQLLF